MVSNAPIDSAIRRLYAERYRFLDRQRHGLLTPDDAKRFAEVNAEIDRLEMAEAAPARAAHAEHIAAVEARLDQFASRGLGQDLICSDCGKLWKSGLSELVGGARAVVGPGEPGNHWRPDSTPCEGVWLKRA